MNIPDLNMLNLLPPNITTHFIPSPLFCDYFAEYVGDRVVVEVGAGQCEFAKRLIDKGTKVIAIEPRPSDKVRLECFNFLMPLSVEQVSLVSRPGFVVVAARPDHSGWFTRMIKQVHPKSELIYIGLDDNIHLDIPDEVETEELYRGAGEDGEVVLRLAH